MGVEKSVMEGWVKEGENGEGKDTLCGGGMWVAVAVKKARLQRGIQISRLEQRKGNEVQLGRDANEAVVSYREEEVVSSRSGRRSKFGGNRKQTKHALLFPNPTTRPRVAVLGCLLAGSAQACRAGPWHDIATNIESVGRGRRSTCI